MSAADPPRREFRARNDFVNFRFRLSGFLSSLDGRLKISPTGIWAKETGFRLFFMVRV
jgi:hypothetical protein